MTKEQIDDILVGIDCNSFNRFETFLKLGNNLKGELYWYALQIAYQMSDNLYLHRDQVKTAFCRNQPGRQKLMRLEELEYLKALPDHLSIYRGMTEQELNNGNYGVSWTLKKEVAEFFAFSYIRNFDTDHYAKVVHELNIRKKEVIALFLGRQEYEIIYIPSKSLK